MNIRQPSEKGNQKEETQGAEGDTAKDLSGDK